MTLRNSYVILLLCLLSTQLSAQENRGLYINDFKYIIGNQEAEDKLLKFAQLEDFNYLLLYNLHHINTHYFDMSDPIESLPLALFIEKAKTMYGIEAVGGVGEKFASFEKMRLFNLAHDKNPERKLDVFNIEFEFWNTKLVNGYYCTTYLSDAGYNCNISGAYDFYLVQLQQLAVLADDIGVKSETYIGKPNDMELANIGETVDRVLVHYYKKKDTYNNGNSIYNYRKERLPGLSPKNKVVEVMPIFSSRSSHMGPWLQTYPKEQAFDTWLFGQNGFEEDTGDWKNNIDVCGYQWYRYTDMYFYLYNENAFTRSGQKTTEFAREWKMKNEVKIDALVFPNPATSSVTINIDALENYEKNSLPQIFNHTGKLIWTGRLNDTNLIDVRNWSRGFYFLKINNVVKKIVLQ